MRRRFFPLYPVTASCASVRVVLVAALVPLLSFMHSVRGDDMEAVARGKKALETRAFSPPPWPFSAYENAWKQWQPPLDKPPENYDAAFRDYYGLPATPYENGRYPMGLRQGQLLFFKGLTTDCMICHGGSILGKSYIGLGNSSADIQSFFEDLNRASGRSGKLPFTFSNVRGTSEAGGMAVYLHSFRNADLSIRLDRQQWDLHDDLCEDTPAWWLLKKKKTMYHTGSTNARSVRSIMQFMLSPTNLAATFDKEEAVFRDIQAFLLSLEVPRYPFSVDESLASKGKDLFSANCAKCHGTYGPNPTYPNKIVPLATIGTDPSRFQGLPAGLTEFYNGSWFAKESPEGFKAEFTVGYQAPPLDGVWATAPYLHNGSLPTLYDVLNSKTRPNFFTRSYRTDESAYDKSKVGWKVELLPAMPSDLPPHERRKIYDTSKPGRSNRGHTFGDDLTDAERFAVIEYLKTL